MTKRVDQEKRFAADKNDKDGDGDNDDDDGDGVEGGDGGDDDDDERLLFKMIVGDLAVWTPGEYRGVSRRPHRNPIFG